MFNFWIAKPVEANQSGSHQKLERLIKATCLRRTKKALAGSLDLLPPIEEIEYVELHTEDQELYDFFKMKTASIAANMKSKKRGKTDKGESILPLMNFLRLICNHGEHLLPSTAMAAWRNRNSTSINLQVMKKFQSTCRICSNELEETNEPILKDRSIGGNALCRTCSDEDSTSESASQNCGTITQMRMREAGSPGNLKYSKALARIPSSAKVHALLRKLRAEQENGDPTTPIKRHVILFYNPL